MEQGGFWSVVSDSASRNAYPFFDWNGKPPPKVNFSLASFVGGWMGGRVFGDYCSYLST